MKHIFTAILLALAVVAGLLLPQGYIHWQDHRLQTPQVVEITEPTLTWNPSKSQDVEKALTEEDIAQKLKLMEIGPSTMVPLGNATTDEVLWAASRAIEFLNVVFEVPPDIHGADAEYTLAWFESSRTTLKLWTAWVEFNGNWTCLLIMDGESGAILQAVIHPNGADLAELFPESFDQAGVEYDLSFENLVSRRVCHALGHFMGRTDGGANPVVPAMESGLAYVTFADREDLQVEVQFIVDLEDGIRFNTIGQY